METKVCSRCGIEKNVNSFEYRSDCNNYRNTCKECRNEQRREKYYLNHEEILSKKRERYKEDPKYKEYRLESNQNRKEERKKTKTYDIKIKIKNQLKRALDKSFARKELKRRKPYEELLCCGIDEAVDYLIDGYAKKYEKDLTINDEVDIDHILSLWSAYKQESIEDLCCYKNLRLLTKRDNHNRKYKIIKEDSQLIKEYFSFLHKYKDKNNLQK